MMDNFDEDENQNLGLISDNYQNSFNNNNNKIENNNFDENEIINDKNNEDFSNYPTQPNEKQSVGYEDLEVKNEGDEDKENLKRRFFSASRIIALSSFICVILLVFFIFITIIAVIIIQIIRNTNPLPPIPPIDPNGFKNSSTVILISIDSFRTDYLTKYKDSCKTLNSLRKTGISPRKLISQMPSKTFPNHFSIITGLHTESHGIISNKMYDPRRPGKVFQIGNTESFNSFWWNGEPLWVTAQNQNIKSGVVFWPGSEVKIKGQYPTYYHKYDGSTPKNKRVNYILEYLSKPKKDRPRFLTLYFSEVDTKGHLYSPNSNEVKNAILHVDNALKYLIEALESVKIRQYIDIIVVSDHGMTSTPTNDIIYIDDYLPFFNDCCDMVNTGPIGDIWLKGDWATDQNKKEMVYNHLKNISSHINVYFKEEIPERYHVKNNVRVPQIYCVADDKYTITTRERGWDIKGNHGYDPLVENMQATFIGNGPSFKNDGQIVEPFENIEIYNLISKILNIKPSPNNGTLSNVINLLK